MSCLKGLFGETKLLPIKVQDVRREKRIGIVCKSLSDLKKKACVRFEVPAKKVRFVLESDGTEVDDDEFFLQLEPQTVLVILDTGQAWQGRQEVFERALDLLTEMSQMRSLTKEIRSLFVGEENAERRRLLGTFATSCAMNVTAEKRKEDPEWFEDVPAKFHTKDSYMRERSRKRIRSYLYHAKDHIAKQKVAARAGRALDKAVNSFFAELKNHDFNALYFSRAPEARSKRMCDESGWFHCEGLYNCDSCCHLDHDINPYGSKATRVLFSTWDLDHGIEKSREVLPRLVDAAQKVPPTGSRLNWLYFYSLLFTRHNLKLVHPVCHDKGEHTDMKCDPKKVFIKS